ncbi:MAG: YraN family protein [Clostridia bacterium]|nr:YraN family protein [Clostridia bacterium]
MIKNKSGVWGEIYAARYLRDNKYKIITSNYVCRFGELDLVAFKNKTLCIVEVKTRDEETSVRPMEAVDENKQERITMAANSFLRYSKLDYPTRFDVCEVYLDKDCNPVKINYMENAF